MYQSKIRICAFPGCENKTSSSRYPYCFTHYGKHREARAITENGCSVNGCYLIATHQLTDIFRVCDKHYHEEIKNQKNEINRWKKENIEMIKSMEESEEKQWLLNKTEMHDKFYFYYFKKKYTNNNPYKRMLSGNFKNDPFIIFLRQKIPTKQEIIEWCKNIENNDIKELFREIFKEVFNGTLQKIDTN